MTITQSFYTFTSAVTNITDLLASTDEIWPGRLPQEHGGFPAMTYSLDADDDIPLLDGGVNEMHWADFEVFCWANTLLEAADLAAVVKTELIGVTGTFGANTAKRITKENEFSDFETQTELHFVRLVFRVAYE